MHLIICVRGRTYQAISWASSPSVTFQEFGQPPAGTVARATYKLVVCFDASQYQANALRRHELHPLGFVLWVARRKVQRPVDSRRLSITIVHDIIDMTC